jgi:protein-tyrosine phosphatase
MTSPQWIELDGAVNVRDLGGLPAGQRVVRSGRLIRADNLQGLTPDDVRVLVDEHQVRSVVDLRTGIEVASEGPGPMTAQALVHIEHLSLYPEAGENTDAVAAEGDEHGADESGADKSGADKRRADKDELPWLVLQRTNGRTPAVEHYLRYVAERPDSIVSALRLIAGTDGATVVHCAAGKDRTGVVVAIALAEVGVERGAIVADFALTALRLDRILARLAASPTYAEDMAGSKPGQHEPRAETMTGFLNAIDDQFGGVSTWLAAHGWTESDHDALRRALLA